MNASDQAIYDILYNNRREGEKRIENDGYGHCAHIWSDKYGWEFIGRFKTRVLAMQAME